MAWPPTTHQDVEDDLANGHGWAVSLAARLALGEQLIPSPFSWTSGNYYSSAVNGTATSTIALTASRLHLTPIYFAASRAVDQIAINISTAGSAGQVARLGIYNASATSGLPTTVQVDAGTVPVDSTGAQSVAISASLSGLKWVAITAQGGTATALPVAACPPVGGLATAGAATVGWLSKSAVAPTSAFADLTGVALTGNNLAVPRILLRAA